jgi:hypothetical protein
MTFETDRKIAAILSADVVSFSRLHATGRRQVA